MLFQFSKLGKWKCYFYSEKVTKVHTRAREWVPPWCSMSMSTAFKSLQKAKIFYSEWINEVKRTVPQDRLLEFNVGQPDPWSPLCGFLNIASVPQEPFPRSNDGEAFKLRLQQHEIDIWIWNNVFHFKRILDIVAGSLAWQSAVDRILSGGWAEAISLCLGSTDL